MNRKFILLIMIFLVSCGFSVSEGKDKIIWKNGVAVINGEPAYIDVNKLDQRTMVISEEFIKKGRKQNIKVFKAGKLIWTDEYVNAYNTEINDPYGSIIESEVIFYFKIKKNKMYVTKDKKDWDLLRIQIINENPPQDTSNSPYSVPVFMIIHLKCKWFEGEYELIGTQG